MAKQYIKMCNIKMWENDGDSKRGLYSNSKWTPYRDGSPADVTFRAGCTYSVAAFQNDDGTINIKPVGDAINPRSQPAVKETDDDDIPF